MKPANSFSEFASFDGIFLKVLLKAVKPGERARIRRCGRKDFAAKDKL